MMFALKTTTSSTTTKTLARVAFRATTTNMSSLSHRRDSGARASSSSSSSSSSHKVLVLTGPTAIGKSAAAVRAATLDASSTYEIVSCDSVQVYDGLDVGSGKVTMDERGGVAHHLLSARDPRARDDAENSYDASRYYDDCVRALDDIHARGNRAIVVGGAGMYLKWLTDGKPGAPASSARGRARAERAVEEARARGGWTAAKEALATMGGGKTAASLHENDWYRMTRAYEIALETGRDPSDFEASRPETRFDFRCFFMSAPRVELYRKIDARVEGMMVDGIVDEAAWLLDSGLAPGENIPARSIGYRQAMEFLADARAGKRVVDETSVLGLVNEIQMLNRAYAKRQFTWFRGEERYAWVDASGDSDDVARRVLREFERDEHQGGGEEIADLTKEELNALKRYRPELVVLNDKAVLERVVDKIRSHV